MINCKQASEYLLRREEGKLPFSKRIQLLQHLAVCGLCRLFHRQSRLVKQCAAQSCEHCEDQLSETEKQQLIHQLQQQL
jgi:hypothetical protein